MIGHGVIIKNSHIGTTWLYKMIIKLVKKSFGFIPIKNKNIKFPYGMVFIKDEVEIASGCTIDRGSIDNTVIGNNTYIDNQVHIAHNVKIEQTV